MPTASKAKTGLALKFLGGLAAGLLVLYLFLNVVVKPIPNIKLAGQTLTVEVADTAQSRQKGLSGRENLEQNQGMLFVFDFSSEHSFWMKDMLIPIDMIWLNADKQVVHIEKNVVPESFPTTYAPNTPALYVLETNAGWSDRNNLMLGDMADFSLR